MNFEKPRDTSQPLKEEREALWGWTQELYTAWTRRDPYEIQRAIDKARQNTGDRLEDSDRSLLQLFEEWIPLRNGAGMMGNFENDSQEQGQARTENERRYEYLEQELDRRAGELGRRKF